MSMIAMCQGIHALGKNGKLTEMQKVVLFGRNQVNIC